MRLAAYAVLEGVFRALEGFCGDLAVRFSYCPSCGRNRYAGEPCVVFNPRRKEP